MNWNNLFDKIYVINLPERTDRLAQVTDEMNKYGIPFEVFPAIKHPEGELGIYLTLYALIEKCFYGEIGDVLIFEDDVKFLSDPNKYFEDEEDLESIIGANSYSIFYLGCNTHEPLEKTKRQDVCKVKNAFGCHAMAISRRGMYDLLQIFNEKVSFGLKETVWEYKLIKTIEYQNPIDYIIANEIQPLGDCYCTYPMLATQRNSYSDILGKEVDNSYIEERFIENTKHLPNSFL
jgi:GR25 family glycosyltransferase involved in LPS biosynthesis